MAPAKRPAARSRQSPRRRKSRRSPTWAWRYRRLLFLVGLLFATAAAGLVFLIARVPLPPETATAQTTFLTDINGDRFAELHGRENRVPVRLSSVPNVLQQAVIASEDRNFFRHAGVDPVGLARATWADVRGGSLQGGSTITQQYVKNTYVGRQRTLVRKLREAVLAVKLERKYDKRQILERYLNTIYLGRGAYGVQAAADAYFDKDVRDVTLSESAFLAGLIRSPEASTGGRDSAVARARRNRVLDAMARSHAISSRERDAASREPLTIAALHHREATVANKAKGTEYFVEYVRQQLLRKYPEDLILRGGLRVQTTLDLGLQGAAFDAVQAVLDRDGDPDAAVVAIDNDGRVAAMVGGRDWQRSKVNLAVGAEGGGRGRQGGSAFKPFVLAAMLRAGYSVESSFPGPAKLVIPKADHGRDWEVSNFEDEAYDRINLVQATAKSVNTVYAQLIGALGPEKAVATAHELGITSELEAVPSIALGTQNVSVLEMADAYSTFARGGYHVEPQVVLKVTTADGAVIEDNRPTRTKVLERSDVQTVNYVLRQVVEGGTGTAAAFGKTCAGKTGTTDDYGDAWFVGYTPRLTAAVWLGYAEGQSRPMDNVHGRKVNGGSFPATIFSRFMAKATRDIPSIDFGSQPSFGGRILGARVSGASVSATTTTTTASRSTTSTTRRAVTATLPPPTAPPAPPPEPAPPPATTSTTEPEFEGN